MSDTQQPHWEISRENSHEEPERRPTASLGRLIGPGASCIAVIGCGGGRGADSRLATGTSAATAEHPTTLHPTPPLHPCGGAADRWRHRERERQEHRRAYVHEIHNHRLNMYAVWSFTHTHTDTVSTSCTVLFNPYTTTLPSAASPGGAAAGKSNTQHFTHTFLSWIKTFTYVSVYVAATLSDVTHQIWINTTRKRSYRCRIRTFAVRIFSVCFTYLLM